MCCGYITISCTISCWEPSPGSRTRPQPPVLGYFCSNFHSFPLPDTSSLIDCCKTNRTLCSIGQKIAAISRVSLIPKDTRKYGRQLKSPQFYQNKSVMVSVICCVPAEVLCPGAVTAGSGWYQGPHICVPNPTV